LGLVQQLQEKVRELQKQLEAVAVLPNAYIDNRETEIKTKHQKEIEKLKKECENKTKELEKTEKQDKETIINLQTKINEQYKTIEGLKNQSQNNNNPLSMPNLYALIAKHENYQNIQHIYSKKDIKEREFLKNLLDKLWSFC
jgi:predicted RNase H-like nuclease (RuvC/YqgF family)